MLILKEEEIVYQILEALTQEQHIKCYQGEALNRIQSMEVKVTEPCNRRTSELQNDNKQEVVSDKELKLLIVCKQDKQKNNKNSSRKSSIQNESNQCFKRKMDKYHKQVVFAKGLLIQLKGQSQTNLQHKVRKIWD